MHSLHSVLEHVLCDIPLRETLDTKAEYAVKVRRFCRVKDDALFLFY